MPFRSVRSSSHKERSERTEPNPLPDPPPPQAGTHASRVEPEASGGAAAATKQELAGDFTKAFNSYVQAAQSYLYLIRHAPDQQTKDRLRQLSGKLVERATRIKQAKKDQLRPTVRDRFSVEEQDAVLERSALVGNIRLPRWTPQDEEERPREPEQYQPKLSPIQLEQGVTWQRPLDALPHVKMVSNHLSGRDIVQDNIADCSLVAALIVGAQHHARFGSKLVLSCLFPQDENGLPRLSSTGRYTARFRPNGTWRCISIDDCLPVSAKGQLTSASTRQHDQLWPSLVEKAYLKLMGGYDFHGSNSGIDLHALSGWIPEHIPLDAGFHVEKSWTRISAAFEAGRCVLTVGTGKNVDSASANLTPSHCYAVLDLQERDGRREVELMNPWRRGDEWTSDLREALPDNVPANDTFIVEWDRLPSLFDAIHLNWDPATFKHHSLAHVALPPSKAQAAASRSSSQLRLRADTPSAVPSEIWVLLSRHLTTVPPMEEHNIGLNVVRTWSAGMTARGPARVDDASTLTNNDSVLYRFQSDTSAALYDLFLSYRGATNEPRFTIQVFADVSVKLEDAPPPLPYTVTIPGSWSDKTAGGNHACATFLFNPQYRVRIAPLAERPNLRGEVSVVCNTMKETPVNVKLGRMKGERVADFEERDVVAGTSTYSYSFDSCHAEDLPPDTYTLVVSSFQPGHESSFDLRVESNLPLDVSAIPQEGAGMFCRSARGSWAMTLDGRPSDPRFRIAVTKPTSIRLRLQVPEGPAPISLSVFSTSSDGTSPQVVESTGPLTDTVCGVVTRLIRLPASDTDYIIDPTTHPSVQADFQLFLYADQPVTLTPIS